jgi:hypothetical protein
MEGSLLIHNTTAFMMFILDGCGSMMRSFAGCIMQINTTRILEGCSAIHKNQKKMRVPEMKVTLWIRTKYVLVRGCTPTHY